MTDTYALLIAAVAFAALLAYWQRLEDNFDLRTLIVDNLSGKVSLFKVGQLVALMTSTWVVVHETRRGALTEWLMLIYVGVWAGSNIANKVTEKYKSLEPPKDQTNG